MHASVSRQTLFAFVGIFGSLAVPGHAAVRHIDGPAHVPVLEWRFDTREDNSGTPHSSVYLLVNGHPHLIKDDVTESFYTLDPGTFKTDGIPSTAVSACQGWYGGGGDDYYVVRRNNDLVVYYVPVGEGDGAPGKPVLAKTIALIAHHRRRRPRTWRKAQVAVVPSHAVRVVPQPQAVHVVTPPHGVEDSLIVHAPAAH